MLAYSVAASSIDEAIERKEWQRAVRYHTGEGPVLWVRLPYEELRTSANRVALSGCTEPGAKLHVNGVEVLVHATGAFIGELPLRYGNNVVNIVATRMGQRTVKTLTLHRLMLPLPVPVDPPRIATERGLLPTGPLELAPGDDVTVQFTGSPGGEAWFTIGGDEQAYPMTELAAGASPFKIPGVYRGKYTVQDDDRFDEATLVVHLRIQGTSLEATTSAKLTTLPEKVHTLALSKADAALDTGESSGSALTFLKQPTRLEITGRLGGRYRIALPGRSEPLWASVTNIDKRMPLEPYEPALLSDIQITGDAAQRETRVLFLFDRATTHSLPVLISTESKKLLVTLWGAEHSPEHGQADADIATSGTHRVRAVNLQHSGPAMQYEVEMEAPLWGFDHAFLDDGNFQIVLRHAPAMPGLDSRQALQGITILLSAGHGGDDSGAVGPAGLRESDANLEIARRLARRLREGGAIVEMLRDADVYVSLDERARIIEASKADFMVSIHNNAVSSYTDQSRGRGPLTFFSYGHQLDLAWKLYQHLPGIRSYPASPSPVRQHAFRVTRKATHMPGVLLECLFLSHPEDEMLLLNPAFLDTLVEELYKGLVATLAAQQGRDPQPRHVTFATNKYAVPMKQWVRTND